MAHPTPATIVIAIVGPDVTNGCETTGPTSPMCTQMPLLADHVAGEQWRLDHPGVAMVALDDAVGLAREYASGC